MNVCRFVNSNEFNAVRTLKHMEYGIRTYLTDRYEDNVESNRVMTTLHASLQAPVEGALWGIMMCVWMDLVVISQNVTQVDHFEE